MVRQKRITGFGKFLKRKPITTNLLLLLQIRKKTIIKQANRLKLIFEAVFFVL